MVFSFLNLNEIPNDFDIMNNQIIKNISEESVRALNGPRVAKQILNLVPNKNYFKTTLFLIKLWFQRRGLYESLFGYLNGISCAILVARICQIYPNSKPNVLLNSFFTFYSNWKWYNPIQLCNVKDLELGFKIWDRELNIKDRLDLMPILTPVYPTMNSCYPVSSSNLQVIQMELLRGALLMKNLFKNEQTFNHLFEESDFFVKYKDYIEIEINSENEEDHNIWKAFIESKIRFLVKKIEILQDKKIIHPYPKFFTKDLTSFGYIGISFNNLLKQKDNINLSINEFILDLLNWRFKTDKMLKPKIHIIKSSQLPEQIIPNKKRKESPSLKIKTKRHKKE